MAALRALAAEKTRRHRAQFIGTELDAITLNTPQPLAATGRASALTENFLPVELTAIWAANRLLRIRVTGLAADGTLFATTASKADSSDVDNPVSFAQPAVPENPV